MAEVGGGNRERVHCDIAEYFEDVADSLNTFYKLLEARELAVIDEDEGIQQIDHREDNRVSSSPEM